MAGTTGVTVFVDDAVLGRFPAVCAKTGDRADGTVTLSTVVGTYARVGTAWLLLLLLLGPVGWAALLALALFAPDRGERLTVQLPWTEAAQARVDAARRSAGLLWAAAGAAAVLFVLGLSGAVPDVLANQPAAVTDPLFGALAVAATAATIGALLAGRRAVKASVGVELDGSRRWVTLRGVHPRFAAEVRARQVQDQPVDRPGR